MELGELLQKAGCTYTNHACDRLPVERLVTDSRLCQPGDVFIGMPGTKVDGSAFVASALGLGAIAAIVAEDMPITGDPEKTIVVGDVLAACAQLAAAFYDYPARQMQLVGVTGTNGKTTTTHLIEFLLQPNYATALLGTLYARWQGYIDTASYTTPFSLQLQSQLAQAASSGTQVAVMEVSSHALAQKRVWGCPFAVSVFTNLTQDHLDYHRDLEDYFQAKARLFSPDYLTGRAIVNLDDAYGQRLANSATSLLWTYSLENPQADFYARSLTYRPDGVEGILQTPAGEMPLRSPLVGSFNVANLMAAIASALHLGIPLSEIATKLPDFLSVPGRVERVQVAHTQDITVVVDYAHTPDSLENVLKALRPFTQRELICVFGCGGDRDRTKRPLMGGIAARLSDRVYVTSDNPRTEDPQGILQDIVAGIPPEVQPIVEGDRRQAIYQAILSAQPGDTVAIAGKGHEDYQILGKEKIHFDDREEARAALMERAKTTI